MKNILVYSFFIFFLCSTAQEKRVYEIKNLNINTEYAEFGTAYFGNNQLIFSSSKKKEGKKSLLWRENKQPFLDLYVGTIEADGEISNSVAFPEVINSIRHEANAVYSKELKTLYFTRNNNKNSSKLSKGKRFVNLGIYQSTIQSNDSWSTPELLSFNNEAYSYGHPILSLDGKRLYFVSDMPGGYGKTDLYYAEVKSDGSFGTPINLGPMVNTSGMECFPFIAFDNTLYFSSDGRKGLGKLDIFKIKLNELNKSEPVALEAPINSAFDDFSFVVNQDGAKGYFSSNRNGGKGDDDIYYFETKMLKCKQKIQGEVVEGTSSVKIKGATVKLFDENGVMLKSVVSDENALYSFEIDCNKKYTVKVSNKGFVETTENFKSTDENQKIHNLAIKLQPVIEEFVKVDEKVMIKINPIYFDFNSSAIREDAKVELNKVIEIMNKYPDITIDCGSHTDARGSDHYNLWLSERRAQKTIDYIVSKGISANRISGKGYGESQLINECKNGVKCTVSQHQLNRRTEFVVNLKD